MAYLVRKSAFYVFVFKKKIVHIIFPIFLYFFYFEGYKKVLKTIAK